jgi:hypothetical protein
MSAFERSVAPISLFYSYSHKDEALRNRLEAHLTPLLADGAISGWHDRRITAGTEWEGAISENLDRAGVILLLVSSDFLASPYCRDVEVKRAMERHEAGTARVIPVVLRPCNWQTSLFGMLQALPQDGKPVTEWSNRDRAFTDIARGIGEAAIDLVARTQNVLAPAGLSDPKTSARPQAGNVGSGARPKHRTDTVIHVPTFHFGGVVPPKYFIDRELELHEAERIIASGQSILLSGRLRWGKTSFGKKLIYRLMERQSGADGRILCGYLNLQQCPDLSPETFLEHTVLNMLGEISRHVFGCKSWTLYEPDPTHHNPTMKGDSAFTEFAELYRHVVLRSHSRGDMHPAPLQSREFIYFVGELMALIRVKGWNEFFIFYDEANHLPKKLSLDLLTGNIEALDFTGVVSMYSANSAAADTFGPLKELFGYHIELKPFNEIRDLTRLLARYYFDDPERGEELPIEPGAVNLLWRFSRGVPYCIQLIAGGGFLLACNGGADCVTEAHVRRSYEDLRAKRPLDFLDTP